MTELLVAVVGGVFLVGAAGMTWWLRSLDRRSDRQEARIAAQDARIQKLEARDRASWLYIQSLILHAHTHAPGVPLPEPPAGWMDEHGLI